LSEASEFAATAIQDFGGDGIFRDPRWGRGQETYGEDPYLTGRLAVAYVSGLQGNDADHPMVIATPKHFAVHSGPESLRHHFNSTPAAKDLEETYLPAFRASITEGHPQHGRASER
jgi:beta-glucosidase